ncbi:PIN domain-containing protein [Clostridium sp. DL1XJH146]
MFNKVLKGLFTLIGLIVGYFVGEVLITLSRLEYFKSSGWLTILFIGFISILFGLIFYLLSPLINSVIIKIMNYFEDNIQKKSGEEILMGTLGAIAGLLISLLFVNLLSKFGVIGNIIGIILALIMAALGAEIGLRKKDELIQILPSVRKNTANSKEKKVVKCKGVPKVLDTSVIIDGRVLDISQTGFIEGALIIPNFVLDELRHIADSSDSLKRNRGRRGLDILNKMQKELKLEIVITDKDFPEIQEVDSKLLKLAKTMNGMVITNDYNLNKVAGVQGVPVLNINELANAVKPVVLPGEEMTIQIIKDGKEQEQGIAYLDDGTMIVVEGGRRHINEIMDVIVTSVLQTAAGRMIFAKQKK